MLLEPPELRQRGLLELRLQALLVQPLDPEAKSRLRVQRLPVWLQEQPRRVSQVSSSHPLVKRPSLRANSISL